MRHGNSFGVRRHRGFAPLGTICTLLVLVGTVSLSLKILPHYIDFRTIESVVEQLPNDEVNSMPRAEIYEALSKRFPLNNLYDFKVRDIIQFERGPESTKLTVAYEKREPLFLNIDVVIKFNKQYEYR
jgi:hypothetical protein